MRRSLKYWLGLATHELPTTRHIFHIRLQGDHNNNKAERSNKVRDRE
jgi:hypothetical protein